MDVGREDIQIVGAREDDAEVVDFAVVTPRKIWVKPKLEEFMS